LVLLILLSLTGADEMGVGEIVIAILWITAGVATALAVEGTGAFLYLAPVFVICMAASILIVRKVRQSL
jgi:hypothetical protein